MLAVKLLSETKNAKLSFTHSGKLATKIYVKQNRAVTIGQFKLFKFVIQYA